MEKEKPFSAGKPEASLQSSDTTISPKASLRPSPTVVPLGHPASFSVKHFAYNKYATSCATGTPAAASPLSEPMVPYSIRDFAYDKAQTLCFTGHRHLAKEVLPPLKEKLKAAVLEAYQQGYRCFLSGGALGFDQLAAQAVLELKQQAAPELFLEIVSPCATQSEHWTKTERAAFDSLCARADKLSILSESYYEGCMLVRNRHMVDRSACCICYLKYMRGGTLFTAGYASRSGLKLVNLALDLG